jgi:hypothetical protein
MAEKQVDGGSAEGTATNANGGASENQSVQQPSFDAAKLQEVLDAVGTLSKRVDGLQSVKDKQASELTGLKAQIAEYKELEKRLGPDGAIEQMELKQTLNQMNQTLEQLQKGSVSTQPTGTGESGAVDAAQAIRDFGLDMNDPKVALLASKQYKNQDEVDLAIAKHIRAKKSAPSPTPAQQPADAGQPVKEGAEEATTEYINNVKAARGNPQKVRALREQAIKAGVKVWEIDFS